MDKITVSLWLLAHVAQNKGHKYSLVIGQSQVFVAITEYTEYF